MKKRTWKDILWAVEVTLIIIMTLTVLYCILSPTDMASELSEREPVSVEEVENTNLQPEEEERKNQTVSDSVDSNPVDNSTIDPSNTNTPSYSSSSNSSSGYLPAVKNIITADMTMDMMIFTMTEIMMSIVMLMIQTMPVGWKMRWMTSTRNMARSGRVTDVLIRR